MPHTSCSCCCDPATSWWQTSISKWHAEFWLFKGLVGINVLQGSWFTYFCLPGMICSRENYNQETCCPGYEYCLHFMSVYMALSIMTGFQPKGLSLSTDFSYQEARDLYIQIFVKYFALSDIWCRLHCPWIHKQRFPLCFCEVLPDCKSILKNQHSHTGAYLITLGYQKYSSILNNNFLAIFGGLTTQLCFH